MRCRYLGTCKFQSGSNNRTIHVDSTSKRHALTSRCYPALDQAFELAVPYMQYKSWNSRSRYIFSALEWALHFLTVLRRGHLCDVMAYSVGGRCQLLGEGHDSQVYLDTEVGAAPCLCATLFLTPYFGLCSMFSSHVAHFSSLALRSRINVYFLFSHR